MHGSIAFGCALLLAAWLAGCGTSRQPAVVSQPPDPGSSFDRILRVHVRDYTESPIENVQLATEQQTPAIAPTDQAGNTSIRYRSERLSVFVLNPKEMFVLAPWRGDVDVGKDPERLIIAPKGKPIIFRTATTLRPVAAQVLSATPPEGGVTWPEATALVAKELNVDAAELSNALRGWQPRSKTAEDRALAALCRNDFAAAEREVDSVGRAPIFPGTVQFVRARTMAARRDYSASAAVASEAVALDPANTAFTRSLAFSLRGKGDARGAAAAFLASGCPPSSSPCGALETVSTFFAAKSLERAERLEAATGAYKRVAAAGDNPELAGQARESLRRLGAGMYSGPGKVEDTSSVWLANVSLKYLPWIAGGGVILFLLGKIWQWRRRPEKLLERIGTQLVLLPKVGSGRRTAALVLILLVVGAVWMLVLVKPLAVPDTVPSAEINGTIRDPRGRAVAGAVVRIIEYGREPAMSDVDGRFRVQLRESDVPFVLIHVQKQGYTPAVSSTDSTASPDIVLRSF